MEYADIGQKIKNLRIRKGLFVQELAAKVNLTQGYLSKIENSETPPPIPTLIKIAYGLNVHISYFFGEERREEDLILIKENKRKEVVKDFTLVGCTYEIILHRKEKNTIIKLSGIDKEALGRTAASIRMLRPPEPYKGKGVKYAEERIQKKAGKTGTK